MTKSPEDKTRRTVAFEDIKSFGEA